MSREPLRRCGGAAPRTPARSSSSSTVSTAPPSCSRPAPQTAFDDARPADRAFSRSFGKEPVPEQKVEDKLAKETRFDPDVWIVEVEDRAGRHFLDNVVA